MALKHILVPLDGSTLAEAALPAARYLARTLPAHATLMHIIERNPPQAIHGERHLTDRDEADTYLAHIAERVFAGATHIERHVHADGVDDVATCIVDHAREWAIDLVVMCTHGRGGLRNLLFGSIAQRVLAFGSTPVLLVHPSGATPAPDFECHKLLVPLDGDPDHEQGLWAAVDLARASHASLHLVMAVRTVTTLQGDRAATALLLPGATSALLDMTQDTARQYLQRIVEDVREQHVMATSEVERGDPLAIILETTERVHADLIVLGTHAKTSLDAFWAGSLTPKVAARSRVPLLMIPIHEGSMA